MISLFRNKAKRNVIPFRADVHSHFLPGLDDGAPDLETSLRLLRQMESLGFSKIITTPHIKSGLYENNAVNIRRSRDMVQQALESEGVKLKLEAAAEYYVDEIFLTKLKDKEEILYFGDRYVLIETGFLNYPFLLHEAIFELQQAGYRPVLAHPERYAYLGNNHVAVWELQERCTLFQVNLLAFTGYYGNTIKKFANWLAKNELIDFLGSDCHHQRHAERLRQALKNKKIKNLTRKGKLRNDELLNEP